MCVDVFFCLTKLSYMPNGLIIADQLMSKIAGYGSDFEIRIFNLFDAEESDVELIERAIHGERYAFEKLYRRYAGYVQRVVYRIMLDPQDVEEVVQEVFIRVYQKLSQYQQKALFKTWLYRIAINTALNYRRAKAKHQSRMATFKSLDDHLDYIGTQTSSDPALLKEKVEYLLQYLSDQHRTVIVLRHFEGLSYEEMAETLEINVNTVRSRLSRAREKMLSLVKDVLKNE